MPLCAHRLELTSALVHVLTANKRSNEKQTNTESHVSEVSVGWPHVCINDDGDNDDGDGDDDDDDHMMMMMITCRMPGEVSQECGFHDDD